MHALLLFFLGFVALNISVSYARADNYYQSAKVKILVGLLRCQRDTEHGMCCASVEPQFKIFMDIAKLNNYFYTL